MRKKATKLIAGMCILGLLAGTMSVEAFGIVSETENVFFASDIFSAGAHHAIEESIVLNEDDSSRLAVDILGIDIPVNTDAEQIEETEETEETEENPYANMGVVIVEEYLNIRAEADENAEVLGKIYNYGIATVLEQIDGWCKITSGSVTGFVSADYIVIGEEETCRAAGKRIATIIADTLKLRKEPSTEAGVHTTIDFGQRVPVLDETIEGWLQVQKGSHTGYIAAEYAAVETIYSYAESVEEEKARLAAEEAERKRQEEARKRQEEERKRKEEERKKKEEEARKNYVPPTGGTGQDVVNYAVQFVGNPYVLGGSSLTNGIDCSNFVMRVYEAFGVSLPHHSYALRSVGYEVSASEMQPGDIVCYSGHVAIYMGGGKIVHAANPEDGIEICNKWNYTKVITIRRIF